MEDKILCIYGIINEMDILVNGIVKFKRYKIFMNFRMLWED